MTNRKSRIIVIGISVFVGLLHFIIGPDYNGIFKNFVSGYLIDILLPMNLYLLLQISLRKRILKTKSRIIGALFAFFLGLTVEGLQFYGYDFLGSTYDVFDIAMYALGIIIGLLIDFTILNKFNTDNE